MCLLVMLAQTHPELPLVVGANRDELFERPAVPMVVLREDGPRVLGGRDEVAGGTWLAVNDAGVVAALTNRPTPGGRDLSKRSRGELPVALASHSSAAAAVEAFVADVRSADYNPAWLLVGDRDASFAIDLTGDGEPIVDALPPGVYLLENQPLGVASPKVDRVRHLLRGIEGLRGDALIGRLQAVLGDHHVPPGPPPVDEEGNEVPPQVRAACVHTERYGTRWSGVVTVPAGLDELPVVRYTDGPACEGEYADAGALWHRAGAARRDVEQRGR